MEHKRSSCSSFVDHDDSETSSENAPPDSPAVDSRAAATATTTAATTSPSNKKRRGIHKRVVSVPIGEVDGSRSNKGDAYPPSDSWAWRKYGQKPIKGSPYPRGYYRCSSSKGCPARKQVERSHVNPAMLVITYASEHNHPAPASKQHHHHHQNTDSSSSPTDAATTRPTINSSPPETTPSTTTIAVADDTNVSSEEENKEELFTDPPDFDMGGDTLLGGVGTRSTGDFSWLSDVSFDVPSFVGPRCDDVDVAMFPVLREEDESLFADLGELPECSAVFRRGRGMERCKIGPPTSLCGGTG